jgi:hypothetical protein
MERYCSTGQNPQRVVVPMKEEKEGEIYKQKIKENMMGKNVTGRGKKRND